jgi:hypothetical protein
MKLVKEILLEKFKEESDPIKDLDIGVIREIKQRYWRIIDEVIDKILKGKHEILLYKNTYVLIYYNRKIKLWSAITDIYPKDSGSYLSSYADTKEAVIKRVKLGIGKKLNNLKIKSKLHEKFEEVSDPIHDLGIGGFKAVIQQIFDIDRKNHFIIDAGSDGNINYISMTHAVGRGKENVPGTHFTIHFFSNYFYHDTKLSKYNLPKKVSKLDYAKQLLDDVGILDYFSKIDYVYHSNFIIDCKVKENYRNFFIPGTYHDKQKLTENLNEKFEEQSDPIEDMGIGLKPKEILDNFSVDLQKIGFDFSRELVGHYYNTEYDEIYQFQFNDQALKIPIIKLLFDEEYYELIFALTDRAAEHIIKGSKWGFFYWSNGTVKYLKGAKDIKEVMKQICKIRKITITTLNNIIIKHKHQIQVTKNVRDLLD